MDYKEIIENFLSNPFETLNIELKEWIDLSKDDDVAKLVKSCLALYNNNGGFIAIGFDNNGKTKDHTYTNDEIKERFNFDKIQRTISRYSSSTIETKIHFYQIKSLLYPFVFISSGVKNPASIKSDLYDLHNKDTKLLQEGKIYLRTLSSNGTVSTSEPKNSKDWDRLLNICLENKEADIAKFFQNNFTEQQLDKIRCFLSLPKNDNSSQMTIHTTKKCLEYGYTQYSAIASKREISPHGAFQVAFTTSNNTQQVTISQSLLQILKSSNPRPSGWPLWVVLQDSSNEDNRPKNSSDNWHAFIDRQPNSLDFWLVGKNKCFYHYRALKDDINGASTPQAQAAKLKELDFVWQVQNICDAFVTAIAFARALQEDENTTLSLIFKWSGLKNRLLSSWAHPDQDIYCDLQSNNDDCSYEIKIPINATKESIINYTFEVASQLFLTFGGYDSITKTTIKKIVINYLQWN